MQENSVEGDDDEFWQVALNDCAPDGFSYEADSSSSSSFDLATDGMDIPLQLHETIPVSLSLCSLPLIDGVWSPLGGQAWYGSALLTALLVSLLGSFSTDTEANKLLKSHLEGLSNVNCLELGSGAVGLSGLSLGIVLAYLKGDKRTRVVLTDVDTVILQQLRINVENNLGRINDSLLKAGKSTTEYFVERLDWTDGYSSKILKGEAVQLVIGSELVYTTETAQACIGVVTSILEKHSDVLIVIVQVTDRDGWQNVFLPAMRQTAGVCVVEMPLTDATLHEHANYLIRHGGTLDRFDFSLCYIRNTTEHDL